MHLVAMATLFSQQQEKIGIFSAFLPLFKVTMVSSTVHMYKCEWAETNHNISHNLIATH